MVVGTIIGASIFVQPAEVTASIPSVSGVLLVWVAAGALTLIGALVCAELSSIFTRSGGVYVYLTEAFGPWLGFLWGWAMFWCIHTGIIAVVAVVFARYAGYLVPLGDTGGRLLAIGVILFLTWVNYLGIRQGTRVQTLFTAGKLVAVLLIVVVGFALGGRVPEHFVGSTTGGAVTVGDFLNAMVAGLFAFGGWHLVTYTPEETVDPARTIPRALIIGTLIVTVTYILMNTVYLYVMPLDQVAASNRVAADLADTLLGSGGGILLSVIVLFSTFGALTGIILASPRVYLAMARDGVLFRWAGAVHPTRGTPHLALLLQAVWASILVATGTFRALFTLVIYTEWIFLGLMAVGLVLLRRRPDLHRQYSIPGYPVLPLLFAGVSFAIVINQVIRDPAATMKGLGLVLLGVPVYLTWRRLHPATS
jgi:APA family basic amino acid/polyamine antiporter